MAMRAINVNGIEVFNAPEKFYGDYIVITWIDGKAWYYGSYKTLEQAERAEREYIQAREIIYNW